ncbi:MAG: hypothetical protein ABID54_06475 [Pseudomonadota bacterium]
MVEETKNNGIFSGLPKNLAQLFVRFGKKAKLSMPDERKTLGKKPADWMEIIK